MRFKLPLALAATVALGLTACGSESSPPAAADGANETTLKVGTIGIAADAAIQSAIDKGYFAEEGIDVEVSVVANPPAGIAAAQSGQLDLTYTPSIPMLNAKSQGVPLTVAAAADGYPDDALEQEDLSQVDDTGLYVAADSGIDSPKDLEGKRVSVPARRAQLEVTVSQLVKDDGGDPAKVNWMVLDPASALQSLKDDRIDAASLVTPFTGQAASAGNTLLASPGVEFFEKGAIGLWVAGSAQAESKQDQLLGFQRAIYKANAYANDNLDESQKQAAEITGLELEAVKAGATPFWPVEVRLEDVQRTAARMTALGFLAEEPKLDQSLFLSE
ncbi:ABC transporter substrate-binding protein [Arthrobacter crystallopoietes]|uniref:ABC transporter substrate-binding protein n=1 Tax=Crystallibacter crystallopoietes TaxID=37928 RepID=UPI001ABDC17A|nr:ABC transporter substrate-binding protein [Arthrobacter crystallopoietes]QTG81278.1 ABC transporter substrate-binding protein [Arthrobacter crystallopoietes]